MSEGQTPGVIQQAQYEGGPITICSTQPIIIQQPQNVNGSAYGIKCGGRRFCNCIHTGFITTSEGWPLLIELVSYFE